MEEDKEKFEGTVLKKEGLFVREWDGEEKTYKDRIIKEEEVFSYLNKCLDIEEGVVFENLIRIVSENESLKTFLSMYSLCWDIDAFHKEIFEGEKESKDSSAIVDNLVICRYGEVHNSDGKKELESFIDFGGNGRCIDEEAFGDCEYHESSFGVGCGHLGDLKEIPIILNIEYKIENNKSEKVFVCNQKFTLLEVLNAVYDEISFYGSPEDRDSFFDDLVEQRDQYFEAQRGKNEN